MHGFFGGIFFVMWNGNGNIDKGKLECNIIKYKTAVLFEIKSQRQQMLQTTACKTAFFFSCEEWGDAFKSRIINKMKLYTDR